MDVTCGVYSRAATIRSAAFIRGNTVYTTNLRSPAGGAESKMASTRKPNRLVEVQRSSENSANCVIPRVAAFARPTL